ncbi:MAG TPA: hypothetical protein VFT09_01200 [Ilumatobacteraceae bacterium]|nr:hypothetical protein [Ilumatobacteraceae bacterium]
MIGRARGPVPTAVAAVVVAGALSSCATTYDTSATTVASAPATTVFVATGSTPELLAAISAEVALLSEKLVDNDGQRDALARIEAQWAVARPTVATDRPELLDGFDAAIAQVRRSVERRRPADADKAAKNLATLIAAYQA